MIFFMLNSIERENSTAHKTKIPTNKEYFLKRVSFGSKDCTKELKLECEYFLGQTS